MRTYHVTVIETNEDTGEVRNILEGKKDTFTGLTILGDTDEDHACVTIFNDNLMNIAAKIAGNRELLMAAKLAVMMKEFRDEKSEDDLLDSIMGGLQ